MHDPNRPGTDIPAHPDDGYDRDAVARSFEDEVFHGLRWQRNRWMATAAASLALAALSVGALAAAMPFKEVRPYLVMVDRTTGEAERVARVAPLDLAEREAVRQAELVRYVTDRETFDPADNATRIPEVLSHSREQARASLVALWTAGARDYPPDTYAADARVTATIVSVALLTEDDAGGTAQVRFRKALRQGGEAPVERDFVATVGFHFEPRVERNLEAVWANPLGFVVTSYRTDAETLAPRSAVAPSRAGAPHRSSS